MTVTVKTLVAGTQLTAAASTYYLAPANTKAIIHNATIYNTHSSNAVLATVHVVDTGASETSSNIVINRVISGYETYRCPEMIGKTISATGTIRALAASTSTFSFHVSGVEVT